MATVTIRPNSDDANFAAEASSGNDLYAVIDEETLDTGDYLTILNMNGGGASFGWTSPGLSSATINSVTFHAYANTVRIWLCDTPELGASTYGAFSEGTTNNWSIQTTKNPATDKAWTVSDLTNLSMGIWADGGDRPKDNPILYQLYAVVDYEESAGGDDYTLSCAAGSYSLAGVACTLTYTPAAQNLTLSCGAGSYALTGSDVTLTATIAQNLTLICSAGSYTVTGSDAGFEIHHTLALANGEYVLTGVDIAFVLQRNYTLSLEAGSYTLTGSDAIFEVKRNYTLAIETGSYSLTGTNADLEVKRNYTLSLEAGSYTLTGSDASLLANYSLTLDAGEYTLTGSDAIFEVKRNYTLSLEAGSYSLTGSDATIWFPTPTPDCRTLVVESEYRTSTIDAENRTLTVEAENRTMTIKACT